MARQKISKFIITDKMNFSKLFKTLLIGATLVLISHNAQAQEIKRDTIRESRLSSLAEAIGDSNGIIVADDATLNNQNWFVSFGIGANSIIAEGNNKINNVWDRRRGRINVTVGH